MEDVVNKRRPPYVYFAIFVFGLAAVGIVVGLFKSEVVDETPEPTQIERKNLDER